MIPRVRIAHLPTMIEPLANLSAALGGPRLWVKRDDQTGLAFGGNKTRKLEFSMAEAQANGARTLITVGAAQSNHCRQTAALANRFGMDCILVLSGDPQEPRSGNALLEDIFGVEQVWCDREERDETFEKTFQKAWDDGRRPYAIPVGASNATGTLGYVFAFDEMLAQSSVVEPDWVVIASSSGGTQAGLALGAKRANWAGKVLGISIDHPAAELQQTVAGLACEASERFGQRIDILPDEILVNDDYLGAGYGEMAEPEIEAIRLFARHEGLLLDPVYTGRAAAGLIGLIGQGFFSPSDQVLFWHTGGQPALFAQRYQELLSER